MSKKYIISKYMGTKYMGTKKSANCEEAIGTKKKDGVPLLYSMPLRKRKFVEEATCNQNNVVKPNPVPVPSINIELNGNNDGGNRTDDTNKRKHMLLRKNTLSRRSNGWSWLGKGVIDYVITKEEKRVLRKCYPAMKHRNGDVLKTKDCVLVKSSSKNSLPFVGKIIKMWHSPPDDKMMVSLQWYYRPEDTEGGRLPHHHPDELFSSKHLDHTSVQSIERKCSVFTYNKYLRTRPPIENGASSVGGSQPTQLLSNQNLEEQVFFSRGRYDYKTKEIIVKN